MTDKNHAGISISVLISTVSGIILAFLNLILIITTDRYFSEIAGAVSKEPNGWTRYDTPSWMFGSPLCLAIAIHPVVFVIMLMASGFYLSFLIAESIRKKNWNARRLVWIFIVATTVLIIRIPIPGELSLYYFTSVRY